MSLICLTQFANYITPPTTSLILTSKPSFLIFRSSSKTHLRPYVTKCPSQMSLSVNSRTVCCADKEQTVSTELICLGLNSARVLSQSWKVFIRVLRHLVNGSAPHTREPQSVVRCRCSPPSIHTQSVNILMMSSALFTVSLSTIACTIVCHSNNSNSVYFPIAVWRILTQVLSSVTARAVCRSLPDPHL